MKKIRFYNKACLEIFEFEDLPGYFPPHFHDYWVIGCLKSGKREFQSECLKETLDEGCIVALNPGQIHSCLSRSGTGQWLGVNISRNYLLSVFPDKDIDKLRFNKVLFNDESFAFSFLDYVARVIRDDAPQIFSNFLSILLYEGSEIRQSTLMQQVCMQIEDRQGLNSVEDMAGFAHMEKTSFIRKFAREVGITPYKYLQNVRLGRARKMIAEGTDVACAALENAYYDQSHFHKAFTICHGMTPGFYKKSIRK